MLDRNALGRLTVFLESNTPRIDFAGDGQLWQNTSRLELIRTVMNRKRLVISKADGLSNMKTALVTVLWTAKHQCSNTITRMQT